jgi:hypothetical protein
MYKSTIPDEEFTLAQVEGLYHDGLIATPGLVVITDRRLVFTPNAAYQLLGAKSVEFATNTIERAEIAGLNRILKVHAGGQQYAFSGPKISVIRDRVASMLVDVDASWADFQDNERVLSVSDAQRPVGKLLATEGQLVVSTERVRFRPSGVGGLVWREASFSCPISEIESMDLTGRRGQLSLRTKDAVYLVTCNSLPEVHGTIRSVQDHISLGESLITLEVTEHRVLMNRGALAIRGAAVVTGRRFSFIPAGLDRLAGGAERIEVLHNELLKVEMPPRVNRQLVLEVEDRSVTVRLDNREVVFDYLIARLCAGVGVAEAKLTEDCESRKDVQTKVFRLWSEHLPEGVDKVELFEPAVYLNERGAAQPGWLSLRGRYGYWLPTTSPDTGAAVVTLPLRQVFRGEERDPASSRIDFSIRGHKFCFVPRAGASVQEEFWKITSRHRVGTPKVVPEETVDDLNRRETFRVLPTDEPLPLVLGQIHVEGKKPRIFQGGLVDFSLGGCGIVVADRLEDADELYLQVRGKTDARLIQAQVIYQRENVRPKGFRLGIRFHPANSIEVAVLRSSWMEMQRLIATRRSED